MSNMLQYSVWSNCCNQCDFCLRRERIPYSKEKQLKRLDRIKHNLDYIDWKCKYSDGISLLGGELYYIQDEELQKSFLELIDLIIEKVLLVSPNPNVRYSTVTNGLYDPAFLIKVLDKIQEKVGIQHVDLNFSVDLKYRYHEEGQLERVIDNVNLIHNRYQYKIGIQMILTQHIINRWMNEGFDIVNWVDTNMPGNQLCLLYPHPIFTGKKLDDFFFNRTDFLKFIKWLKDYHYIEYLSFMHSTKNSATYKWTGLKEIGSDDVTEQPKLTDGKEVLMVDCGHSVLYKCYADSDRCMLCDILALDEEAFYG